MNRFTANLHAITASLIKMRQYPTRCVIAGISQGLRVITNTNTKNKMKKQR